MITRRQFVELGGTLAAASALACEEAPPQLASLLTPATEPVAPPASDDVDLVSHVVGRLSFGPRPRDTTYGKFPVEQALMRLGQTTS